MRILILSQYFPPEIGAPQTRLYELAVRLRRLGAVVDVLTAFPNYPENRIRDAYIGKWYTHERISDLDIHRTYVWVVPAPSLFARLLTYGSFVFSSLIAGLVRLPRPDVVFCESPPLFLGITGYLLARAKGAKFVFNVSDLWPESAVKLGLVTNPIAVGLARWLEKRLYSASHLITGQTQGIVDEIRRRMPAKRVLWVPNGAETVSDGDGVRDRRWRHAEGFGADDVLFLYAGLMGHAQGLEVIIKAAAKLTKTSEAKFILMGAGPRRDSLLALKQELKAENVYFFDAVPRAAMSVVLSSVDVGIVPLRRLTLFRGAIPSKIFELLAMRVPVLLGVEGEAKQLFVDEGRCAIFFTPEDEEALAAQVIRIIRHRPELREMGERGWAYVNTKFHRDRIAAALWKSLCEVAKSA